MKNIIKRQEARGKRQDEMIRSVPFAPWRPASRRHQNNLGQSIIEFTFASVVTLLMIFCMVQVVRWVMMDLANRRYEHDVTLTNGSLSVPQQLRPNFYKVRPADALLYHR